MVLSMLRLCRGAHSFEPRAPRFKKKKKMHLCSPRIWQVTSKSMSLINIYEINLLSPCILISNFQLPITQLRWCSRHNNGLPNMSTSSSSEPINIMLHARGIKTADRIKIVNQLNKCCLLY